MSDNTQTMHRPTPPVVPGGDELYNSIMSGIEMDLTTEHLPTLKEKYASETEQERTERMNRYKNAFEMYEKQLDEFGQKQEQDIRTFERELMNFIEHKDRSSDDAVLHSLEQSMQNT